MRQTQSSERRQLNFWNIHSLTSKFNLFRLRRSREQPHKLMIILLLTFNDLEQSQLLFDKLLSVRGFLSTRKSHTFWCLRRMHQHPSYCAHFFQKKFFHTQLHKNRRTSTCAQTRSNSLLFDSNFRQIVVFR